MMPISPSRQRRAPRRSRRRVARVPDRRRRSPCRPSARTRRRSRTRSGSAGIRAARRCRIRPALRCRWRATSAVNTSTVSTDLQRRKARDRADLQDVEEHRALQPHRRAAQLQRGRGRRARTTAGTASPTRERDDLTDARRRPCRDAERRRGRGRACRRATICSAPPRTAVADGTLHVAGAAHDRRQRVDQPDRRPRRRTPCWNRRSPARARAPRPPSSR